MIKVLHSELQGNIGGIESFLLNLTTVIDKTDLQFDFLMRGNNEYLEKRLTSLGARIFKVPDSPIEYFKFIKKFLQNESYDYVHIHKNSAANIIFPTMVKKYNHAKLIVHSHNTNPSSGSKLGVLLHRINKHKLLKLSDYRFACSDTAAIWMFGNNYKDKNVQIIKNGIIAKDYEYNPTIRREYRKKLNLTNKFVITNVGAFRKQKNHEFLLDLFSKLNIPNKVLILVGDGELKQSMEDKAKKIGIQSQVLFLGSRNDVANLLQASDIFVMPSLWEGLSVSTIEAQASGLQLVLSDNVSKLTAITNNVQFLSLDNVNKWIKVIIKNKNIIRTNQYQKIYDAGYSMERTAKVLKDFYIKNI